MKVKVFVLDGLKIHKHMIENGIFTNEETTLHKPSLAERALTLNKSADLEQRKVKLDSLSIREETLLA
jgi:hypothetical protein